MYIYGEKERHSLTHSLTIYTPPPTDTAGAAAGAPETTCHAIAGTLGRTTHVLWTRIKHLEGLSAAHSDTVLLRHCVFCCIGQRALVK
jgi:hypothetical protein